MIRTARIASFFLLAAWLSLVAASRLDAQAKARPSLDDELMKELQGEPIDDVDRELFGPAKKPAPGAKEEDLKERLSRQLGTAALSEDDHPMLSIAEQMRAAEGLIGRTESGSQTQEVQDRIVAELNKMIEEARKNCAKSGAAGKTSQTTAPREKVSQPSPKPAAKQGKPTAKPARTSDAAPGQGQSAKPDMGQIRAILEKQLWGSLPERQRQQLLQLPMEEFLPKYEPLIIEYFKRLTEEQGRGERRGQRP